jgi:hypothetical protein
MWSVCSSTTLVIVASPTVQRVVDRVVSSTVRYCHATTVAADCRAVADAVFEARRLAEWR